MKEIILKIAIKFHILSMNAHLRENNISETDRQREGETEKEKWIK